MAKRLLPPIHPAEILREEFMKPLELSSNALANRLGVTAARVVEKRVTAIALGDAGGTSEPPHAYM